jgi:predicted phosphodiesterase
MRIVQLSDIHLNNENLNELKSYYLEALIKDMKSFHDITPIDVILFTGDLVDKGGESLGKNPYEIFLKEIINPLMGTFGFTAQQILLIPGNHDVDRKLIDRFSEAGLCSDLDSDSANEVLVSNKDHFTLVNKRIEQFKKFEHKFHEKTPSYFYSNNESATIIGKDGEKVGFVLVNDSWRCSSTIKKEQHYIGYNQLFNAKQFFSKNKTVLNIAVFHHPLNSINQGESDEIENILKSQEFDIAFFGHSHKYESKSLTSSIGGYLTINGRSAFNQPKERLAKFQPGYNIIDVDPDKRLYTLYSRKFIRESGYRFDRDTDSLPNGNESAELPTRTPYYELVNAEDSSNEDRALPNSYSADVHRIVNLLIGKSLYPDPYAFVRELIQNSVDACDRIRKKQTHLKPKIIININTQENYLEVIDEGDGMSKNIIKNHFSVIGKSISQEFNDSTGNFNLISQFGIGFMSTFIVAEKVTVNTKNIEDDQIVFEINDVFKVFNYLKPSQENLKITSGTSICVHLKKGYNLQQALEHIKNYCRHIENLEINYDSAAIPLAESWNLENANYTFELVSEKYKATLGISEESRPLIATNSGFLITYNPKPLIPFKFPSIIGGEVNFNPKGIDFDMSRTNIMKSDKSDAFRREISVSLRKLFRDALESGKPELMSIVVNYLHFYLVYYNAHNVMIQDSYIDFYSKKELIALCNTYTIINYQGWPQSLANIITILRSKNLDKIYYTNTQTINDYQTIVIQYLQNQGYLIINNKGYNVQFQEGPAAVGFVNVVVQIANEFGISVIDINKVQEEVLKDMRMDKSQFNKKLQVHIEQIETKHAVVIEIGKFSRLPKPSVKNGNQIFLNFDHETFQSLLNHLDIPDNILEIYLLGLLGLQLILLNPASVTKT